MKRATRAKGPTALSVCYSISLKSTAWGRQWCSCMLTSVSARIRRTRCWIIWWVMVGVHQQIILSFLIAGHTGVGCLADFEHVVNISAEANITQPVGTQSGEVVVPTYNWTSMFAGRLKRLKHIKNNHHFKISASTPGSVCVKMESDSDEENISLLIDHTWVPTIHNLPPVVVPSGLSLYRQWYLYNQIREYCPDDVRNVTATHPSILCHVHYCLHIHCCS